MEVLPPPKFKGKGANLSSEWRNFLEEFTLWLDAVDKTECADGQKIALLLLSMGQEYRTVFNTSLGLTADTKKVYETVAESFGTYFEPRKIRKGYITEFQNRKQGQNETVQQYITALRDLGSRCTFAGDRGLDDQLCVTISNGVRDVHLRDKLWSTDMSLDDIVKKCQLWEQKEQTKKLYSQEQSYEVHSIRGRQRHRGRGSRRGFPQRGHAPQRGQSGDSSSAYSSPRAPQQYSSQLDRGGASSYRGGASSYRGGASSYRGGAAAYRGFAPRSSRGGAYGGNTSNSCQYCGTEHARDRCPAYGKRCNACHRFNHFAKVCSNQHVFYTDEHTGYDYECYDYEPYDTEHDEYGYEECDQDETNLKFAWYNERCDSTVTCEHENEVTYEHENEVTCEHENEVVCEHENVVTCEHEENEGMCEHSHKGDTDETVKYVWCNETNNQTKENWSVQLLTPGGNVKFKIDTAAEVNVMSRSCYEGLKVKPHMQKTQCKVFGLGKQRLTPVGVVDLSCTHKGKSYTIACEIIDGHVPNLLSLHDSVKMGLVKRVLGVDAKSEKSVSSCQYKSVIEIIDEFADVFEGIGKVPGEVSLKVDPTVTPVAHPPRPVPVALRDMVLSKLHELEKQEIIEKIPVGTPTPWCSPLHVVPKKNGSVRLTMDPKDLNSALLREYHPSNTVEEVAQRCGQSSFFTVLDANQGYFQLQLDEQSKNYTAFNTPFGRYRYKRLPMGITSAPELFQHVFSDIFSCVDGVEMIMDDFLIAADTLEDHNMMLRDTLQKARENHVTFSLDKLQLCKSEVMYSGHKFTKDGLKMDEEKIKAVLGMQEPESVADIERLIGMVTYVGKYLKNLSSVTEPLRGIIKQSKEIGFQWHFDQIHKEAFKQLKQLMSTSPVLKYYSQQEPIVISCDASQSGLGCVLFQDNRPVAYGSKALTTAEYAYAQIEKELLAIVFAFKKFHTYVYGRNDITVETDHLPLVRIFQKPLHQVPLRLQKMRMRLQGYDFKLVAKRGTEIPVADALSRAFLKETGPNLTDEDSHIFTVTADEVISTKQMSPPRIAELQRETAQDDSLQAVISVLNSREGWPSARSQVDPRVRPYFDFHEEISLIDGILYKGERVVVPEKMRKSALDMLHSSHQGIVKTKQLARDLVYWPGINKQIEDTVSRCASCQERRNVQQKEPLCPTPVPTRPWEHVAEDLFDCLGHKWLICVDYYSEYFEIEKMSHTDGHEVIKQTKKWFCGHGIPDKVTTDNGPPWNGGVWSDFADHFGFVHNTISPKHSQSNGMVEKAVGIAKNMLLKCNKSGDDPYLALLNIRNTPRDDTTGSPAQRLYSRRTATRLPTAKKRLMPQVKNPTAVTQKLTEDRHVRAKKYFDRGTKPLEPLKAGDTIRVRIGNTWQPAALLLPNHRSLPPRSYPIQLPSGRQTRRNRRDLLLSQESNIYHREEDIEIEDIGRIEPVRGATQPVQIGETPPNSPIRPPTQVRNPPLVHASPSTLPRSNSERVVQTRMPPEIRRSSRESRPPLRLADYVP
jgi:hypothetical protein